MKFKALCSRGFTLVELMIVIAIIALLSGIILTSVTGSKAKSRDAARISDVNQIQLALEQYFDRCGQYPLTIVPQSNQTLSDINNGCAGTGVNLGSFISVIPKDPSDSSNFGYATNANGSNPPTDYVIHATLESSNAAQQNSFPEITTNKPLWISVTCYNGTPGSLDYCVSTH